MNADSNRAIATELFARLSAKDATGALALTSDDMQWWLPPGIPGGGTWLSKAQESQNFAHLFSIMDGAFRQDIVGMTVDGDRVAVEVEGEGRLADGVVYKMNYHFLLIVRDGLIRSVKEYCDTAMTLRYWRSLTGQDPPA